MEKKRGYKVTDVLKPEQMMQIPRKVYPRTKKSHWRGELAQMTRENLPPNLVPIDKIDETSFDELKRVAETVTELKVYTSKFRDSKINMLLAALRCGVSINKACSLAGISIQTYQSWYNKGKDGIQPYAEFVDILESIRIELEQWCLEAIKHAADPNKTIKSKTIKEDEKGTSVTIIEKPASYDWRAAVWLLEHLAPDEYGKNAIDTMGTINNTTNNVIIQLPSNGRDCPTAIDVSSENKSKMKVTRKKLKNL